MSTPAHNDSAPDAAKPSNFQRQIIKADLAQGTHAHTRWAGTPGDAAHQAGGAPDPARIRTRFPPEPNGYLHIGHAQAICLDFGIAAEFDGRCNLRFDDTNPAREDPEFVRAIQDDVRWLGFEWSSLRHASDYFEVYYLAAEKLIRDGLAYVDDLDAQAMRE